jgi:2,3-bisphosphoglycerate-independent phosphoglycerate mutase
MSVTAVAPGAAARRCVFLILDGLGDLPVAELGGRTPLEAAATPRLDRLAADGRYGLVDPIGAGVIPNTHTGVGMLLGLYPEQAPRLSRGPVEAAGAGRTLEPGEIAFRANLATLERRAGRFWVADRRAGRITEDSAELAASLRDVDLGDGVRAHFVPTDQHRGALVFSGPGLSGAVSDTDPGDRHTPDWLRPCEPRNAAAAFTAAKVETFVAASYEVLRGHPVNARRAARGKLPATAVITRGGGEWAAFDHVLTDRGHGAAVVAGCNTVLGLARMFGMDAQTRRGFTASVDTDVEGKFAMARAALEDHALVYVHVKAPDLFSHDFQPAGKRAFIERLDRALGVFEGSGALLALTADHSTDSNTGAHTADPVPALLHDPRAPRSGDALNFGEAACRAGNLPRATGHDFLLRVLDALQAESRSAR